MLGSYWARRSLKIIIGLKWRDTGSSPRCQDQGCSKISAGKVDRR